MREIFRYLTPEHLRRGFSLYVRAHLKFLIHLTYAAVIPVISLKLPEEFLPRVVERLGFRIGVGAPVLMAAFSVFVYGLGLFPLQRLIRRYADRAQTDYTRAQLGIIETMSRMADATLVLLVATLVGLKAGVVLEG